VGVVIDAANVVGSRPDGWWRDRAGAAGRLVGEVRAAVVDGRLDAPVVVVLEGRARPGAAEGIGDGVEVVWAPGEGDDAIVDVVRRFGGAATVVTADRGLSQRVEALGARVVGPRWLRSQLDEIGGRHDG